MKPRQVLLPLVWSLHWCLLRVNFENYTIEFLNPNGKRLPTRSVRRHGSRPDWNFPVDQALDLLSFWIKEFNHVDLLPTGEGRSRYENLHHYFRRGHNLSRRGWELVDEIIEPRRARPLQPDDNSTASI